MGKKTLLAKHRSIMKLVPVEFQDEPISIYETPGAIEYEAVEFQHSDADEENPADTSPKNTTTQLTIGLALWDELGRPDMITITVVAGDSLNEAGV